MIKSGSESPERRRLARLTHREKPSSTISHGFIVSPKLNKVQNHFSSGMGATLDLG
jgi:hypothetical protein